MRRKPLIWCGVAAGTLVTFAVSFADGQLIRDAVLPRPKPTVNSVRSMIFFERVRATM